MGGIQLALPRWRRESWFYRDRVFRGRVLDLGGVGDPFHAVAPEFPHVTEVVTVDREPYRHGPAIQADLETWSPDPNTADCLISSHTLEHVRNPGRVVRRWLNALRPGGYLLLILPAWETYERRRWPPHVNGDHKTTWRLYGPEEAQFRSLVEAVAPSPDIRLIRALTLDANFNPDDPSDQTAAGTCECGLEAVWRRDG